MRTKMAKPDYSDKIVAVLDVNPNLSVPEIASVLGLDAKVVKATLLTLMSQQKVAQQGKTKGTTYRLITNQPERAAWGQARVDVAVKVESPKPTVSGIVSRGLWQAAYMDGEANRTLEVVADDLSEALSLIGSVSATSLIRTGTVLIRK